MYFHHSLLQVAECDQRLGASIYTYVAPVFPPPRHTFSAKAKGAGYTGLCVSYLRLGAVCGRSIGRGRPFFLRRFFIYITYLMVEYEWNTLESVHMVDVKVAGVDVHGT